MLKCSFNTGPFQVLFRCLHPLNRGVHLIKVSFKVNKRNKSGDFATVCLIEGVHLIRCPLNTGFTVSIAKNYITKICRYSGRKWLNNRNVISLQLFNLILLWKGTLSILKISNGNRTEWSPILSVIIRVINNAGVRFV